MADITEIPAYACALHPSSSAYAYCGRSSKIIVKTISSDSLNGFSIENDEDGDEPNGAAVGAGPLGGEGKVVDTGKGKFAMDINFVSCPTPLAPCCASQADLPVTRRSANRPLDRKWPHHRHRRRVILRRGDIPVPRYGSPNYILVA